MRVAVAELKGNPEHHAFVVGMLSRRYSQIDDTKRALALLDRAVEAARFGSDPSLRDSHASRWAVTTGRPGNADEAIAALDAVLARSETAPELRAAGARPWLISRLPLRERGQGVGRLS